MSGTAHDAAPDAEALAWVLRMGEPAADWDAFMLWLEADPARAAAYDRAALALDEATLMVGALAADEPRTAANDMTPPTPRRARGRGWIGGGLAAAAAAAMAVGLWQGQDASYVVTTRPGEQRTVALPDGSRLMLAGGSRVRLDKGDPRRATVEAGETFFRVRHDPAAPFRVDAGALRLTDLGTSFDVYLLGARTRVAVAEGAVSVDQGDGAVRLDPGQGVVSDGTTLRRTTVAVADVAQWRQGRLAYDGATLREVAADLSRHLGRPVVASAAVAARTFNGTLEMRPLRDDPALLGRLLGVSVRQDGAGWTLDTAR
jgi:transmembrane sensor